MVEFMIRSIILPALVAVLVTMGTWILIGRRVSKTQKKKNLSLVEPETNPPNKMMLITFEHLVLSNKIRLADLPAEIRLMSRTLYVYAFRVSRYFPERYHEDVKILEQDMKLDGAEKAGLTARFFQDYKEP